MRKIVCTTKHFLKFIKKNIISTAKKKNIYAVYIAVIAGGNG